MNEIVITIIIALLIVILIPWYVIQLGRFFCSGILEYLDKILKKEK